MDNLDAQYDYVRELAKKALAVLDRLPACDMTNVYTRRAAKQLQHASENLWEAAIRLRYSSRKVRP